MGHRPCTDQRLHTNNSRRGSVLWSLFNGPTKSSIIPRNQRWNQERIHSRRSNQGVRSNCGGLVASVGLHGDRDRRWTASEDRAHRRGNILHNSGHFQPGELYRLILQMNPSLTILSMYSGQLDRIQAAKNLKSLASLLADNTTVLRDCNPS